MNTEGKNSNEVLDLGLKYDGELSAIPLRNRVDSIESFLLLEDEIDRSSTLKEATIVTSENSESSKGFLERDAASIEKPSLLNFNEKTFNSFLDTGQQKRDPSKKPSFLADKVPYTPLEKIKEVIELIGSNESQPNNEKILEIHHKIDCFSPNEAATVVKPIENFSPRKRNLLHKRNTVAFISSHTSGGLFGMEPKPEPEKKEKKMTGMKRNSIYKTIQVINITSINPFFFIIIYIKFKKLFIKFNLKKIFLIFFL
jgi:hypothetical protein